MTGESEVREIAVEANEAGERLDKWLAGKLDELSRSRIQVLIRAGGVSSAGQPLVDPKERVKENAVYRVAVPEQEKPALTAQKIALNIVYEDEHLIVIDKPAGLVVHPAAGHMSGTLVNALIEHCGEQLSRAGGDERRGIVHRLDKDTSGLMVVTKDDAAHQDLAEQFAAHGRDGRLHRAYRALVWGVPDRSRGVIEADLGRSASNRTKVAVVPSGEGRHAVTHFELEHVFGDSEGRWTVGLLRFVLETGRTHQIRVHAAHIRHPVLGDPVYGSGFKASARKLPGLAQRQLEALGRQALHAAELAFEHPVTGERLEFTSPLPDDMAALIESLERGGEE